MSTNRQGAPNFQWFVPKNKQMLRKVMKIENLFAREKTQLKFFVLILKLMLLFNKHNKTDS